MRQPWLARERRGFTLVEVLIVITLIAILALLVIPRFVGITRRVREVATASNLYELRLSISKFQADTGAVPLSLWDLVATPDAPPTMGGGGITISQNLYRGPYFTRGGGIKGTGIPIDPLKHTSDPDFDQWEGHWAYDVDTGSAWVFYSGETTEGVPYTHM
jgi:prepilin-type N-terminal cleavage/methylation domain-containing protein